MSKHTAADLFAGAGGATRGLKDAGFRMLGAVENDPEAAKSYRANHRRVRLFESDIREVEPESLLRGTATSVGELDLLKACPPCQGFSTLANGAVDERRNDLVLDVLRFVERLAPRVVLLENVPGLSRDRRMPELRRRLQTLGYRLFSYTVDAVVFGVPQRRKRFIFFAVRDDFVAGGEPSGDAPGTLVDLLPPGFAVTRRTARHVLRHVERYGRVGDPLAVHRTSSPVVTQRITAVPVGGTRFDLPEEHQLACHKRLRSGAASAYGRIRLDEPGPTMTTRCTTPACGTFIHPTEHRGLTLREAATFQTFPVGYRFYGTYGSIERQIGNAVPVRMAKALGLIAAGILRTAGAVSGAGEAGGGAAALNSTRTVAR